MFVLNITVSMEDQKKVMYAWMLLRVVHQEVTKDGQTQTYEYAERAPGVRMIIVTPGNKICITKERRQELHHGQWWYDFRLPWGKVVDTLEEYLVLREQGKRALFHAVEDAVRKEAEEEVGIIPETIDFLRVSPCGATMRRDLYYFTITSFQWKSTGQELWLGEEIEVGLYTFDEVRQMCLSGQISEDRSVAVLLQWLEHK